METMKCIAQMLSTFGSPIQKIAKPIVPIWDWPLVNVTRNAEGRIPTAYQKIDIRIVSAGPITA